MSAATGLGYGWLGALGTPASPGSWSVSEVLGRVSRLLLHPWAGGLATEAPAAWRWAGMAAAVALCALLWWYRYRLGVVPALRLLLTAVVVLGPSIRPWYLLWGLAPVAVSDPYGRAGRWLGLCCVALAFSVPPAGFAPTGSRLALAALGVAAAGTGLWVSARVRGGVLAFPGGGAAPGPEPEYSA